MGATLSAAVAVPLTWQLVDASNDGARMGASAAPASGTDLPGTGDSDISGGGSTTLPYGDQGQVQPQDIGRSTAEAATDEQSKGVLLIESTLTDGSGAGTGMVIDSDGVALTNYHVVDGATDLKATVAATGETYPVTVIGHDESADVALIRLEGASGLDTVATDDDDVATSDAVTAVGNAQGQGYLTALGGTVTATGQQITAGGTGSSEQLTGLVETDAPVVGGYSGGPMYDAEGEVVGITTAAASNGTRSYAIPIDTALAVAQKIESGDESGTVQIGPNAFLGISIAATTGAANGGTGSGATVAGVEDDGPAAGAGIVAGDTITAVGDATVGSAEDLLAAVADHEPGDSVQIAWTDASGATHQQTVTLAESPLA
ncbi:hypothetical protein ASD30_01170 [Nocardioides sp. Root140]|nr:hypothetical protein ASD30_01170 [Nocardioides sp. Root140]KRF15663.1 hypothetical protein ASH02_03165 [Nocardioides sp. Soil796]